MESEDASFKAWWQIILALEDLAQQSLVGVFCSSRANLCHFTGRQGQIYPQSFLRLFIGKLATPEDLQAGALTPRQKVLNLYWHLLLHLHEIFARETFGDWCTSYAQEGERIWLQQQVDLSFRFGRSQEDKTNLSLPLSHQKVYALQLQQQSKSQLRNLLQQWFDPDLLWQGADFQERVADFCSTNTFTTKQKQAFVAWQQTEFGEYLQQLLSFSMQNKESHKKNGEEQGELTCYEQMQDWQQIYRGFFVHRQFILQLLDYACSFTTHNLQLLRGKDLSCLVYQGHLSWQSLSDYQLLVYDQNLMIPLAYLGKATSKSLWDYFLYWQANLVRRSKDYSLRNKAQVSFVQGQIKDLPLKQIHYQLTQAYQQQLTAQPRSRVNSFWQSQKWEDWFLEQKLTGASALRSSLVRDYQAGKVYQDTKSFKVANLRSQGGFLENYPQNHLGLSWQLQQAEEQAWQSPYHHCTTYLSRVHRIEQEKVKEQAKEQEDYQALQQELAIIACYQGNLPSKVYKAYPQLSGYLWELWQYKAQLLQVHQKYQLLNSAYLEEKVQAIAQEYALTWHPEEFIRRQLEALLWQHGKNLVTLSLSSLAPKHEQSTFEEDKQRATRSNEQTIVENSELKNVERRGRSSSKIREISEIEGNEKSSVEEYEQGSSEKRKQSSIENIEPSSIGRREITSEGDKTVSQVQTQGKFLEVTKLPKIWHKLKSFLPLARKVSYPLAQDPGALPQEAKFLASAWQVLRAKQQSLVSQESLERKQLCLDLNLQEFWQAQGGLFPLRLQGGYLLQLQEELSSFAQTERSARAKVRAEHFSQNLFKTSLEPHPEESLAFFTTTLGLRAKQDWELLRAYAQLDEDYLAPRWFLGKLSSNLPPTNEGIRLLLPEKQAQQLVFSYLFAQASYTMQFGYENKHHMRALADAYLDPVYVQQVFWGEEQKFRRLTQVKTNLTLEVEVGKEQAEWGFDFAQYQVQSLDLHLSKQKPELEVRDLLTQTRLYYLAWSQLLPKLEQYQACMQGKLAWEFAFASQVSLAQLFMSTYSVYTLTPREQTWCQELELRSKAYGEEFYRSQLERVLQQV
ncbi:hypothetical protein [Psittacicella gerlachiana]|uniref:Uncharacterized protein n=1 Tax=Psittacicella gerlachiana TaxID=2028574 RepID=A0A3A1YIL8_9GAMM|nr:hypothetical protein [Psittacicella gerlachiana]RIY37441.1 hypothetical protein CKF59_01735 [Psittacicella gerlachiana]